MTNAFLIGQTEVTNANYQKWMQAGKCSVPKSTKSYTRARFYGNAQFGNYPVINVNCNDAKSYCTWAGRDLPIEAQWEKAALVEKILVLHKQAAAARLPQEKEMDRGLGSNWGSGPCRGLGG